MKKVFFIGLIILTIIMVSFICLKSFNNGKVIYNNTFYYAMGSEKVKIYENGVVETDKEIEEPNHKTNFKKIKTLTNKEIEELKEKVKENLEDEEMQKYINDLIHNNSNYNLGLPMNY